MQKGQSFETNKLNGDHQRDLVACSADGGKNIKAQVAIIGAGLAGLAAAQRLYKLGIRDVVILEGQDRIGGRVHTVEHEDYLLEMGAQWLHGADDNPLYKWLTEMNMLDDYEDASLGFKGLFCTQTGHRIDQQLVDKVLDIVCDSKLALSKNKYIDLIRDNNYKLASSVFKHQLNERLASDEQLAENRSLVNAIFEWFLRYETIENSCDHMDEVSVASYTDWTDWGDGSLLNFKRGYRSLLEWFCDQFPSSSWINLNRDVQTIELLKESTSGGGGRCWQDENGRLYSAPMLVRFKDNGQGVEFHSSKRVTTETSSASCGTIECSHVIVTISLGCLKKNHETLFKPMLPISKRQLIQTIGYGTVNKIVLQFETPFWSDGNGIKLVWDLLDDDSKREFPAWARDIIAFDCVRRQPNLLIGWIGGEGAKSMELESDESIGDVCLRLFDKFLPEVHCKASKLVACTCSRWNSNPYTCGSYSFRSMGSFGLNVDKLHEPLYSDHLQDSEDSNGTTNWKCSSSKLVSSCANRVPRLMFAGEATSGKLYSTTHGAVISGWREADRLIDHLQADQRATNKIQTPGEINIDAGGTGSNYGQDNRSIIQRMNTQSQRRIC